MKREAQKALLATAGRYIRKLFGEVEPRLKAVEESVAAVPELLQRSLADLPPPANGKDADPVEIAHAIEAAVAKAVSELPKPKDGESIAVEDLAPMVRDTVATEVFNLPKPKDGKDASPEDIERAVAAEVAKLPLPKDGASVTLDDVRPLVEEAVKAIPAPKDGATAEQVREMVAEAVKALPPAKDGESVTVEQVVGALLPAFETALAKAELDFERRAQGVLERAVANMPKPKDGVDGFSLDDLSIEDHGDGDVTLRFSRGDISREKTIRVPCFVDRGVFREIEQQGMGGPQTPQYRKGHGVTFGGSLWIAQKDEPAGKPGSSDDWRLAVKAGRDGSSAYQVALRNGFKGTEKEWVERGGPLPAPVVKVP